MKRSQLKSLIREIVKLTFESPDSVQLGDDQATLYFDNKNVVDSVLCFCQINNETLYFAYRLKDKKIYCNNRNYERLIDEFLKTNKTYLEGLFISRGESVTHSQENFVIFSALHITPKEYHRTIHARIFNYNGVYIFSCWESLDQLKSSSKIVKQFFHDLGYKPKDIRIEHPQYNDEILSYEDVFEKNSTAKKSQLNELVKKIVRKLNEQISPKLWWLDPTGTKHRVGAYEHWNWALIYLTKKEGFDQSEVEKNVYGNMLKLGWSRIALFEYEGKKAIEYDVNKTRPLNARQMKELKDTAIEEGAEELIPHVYDIKL